MRTWLHDKSGNFARVMDVTENMVPEPNSGCFLWLGAVDRHGYARVAHKGKTRRAHRVVWERVHGTIPDGMQLDHLCRVRSCINTAHLELVTPFENWSRGRAPASLNRFKTHCPYGHPFAGANLYRAPGTPRKRVCRACSSARSARQYAAKRAAILKPEPLPAPAPESKEG